MLHKKLSWAATNIAYVKHAHDFVPDAMSTNLPHSIVLVEMSNRDFKNKKTTPLKLLQHC